MEQHTETGEEEAESVLQLSVLDTTLIEALSRQWVVIVEQTDGVIYLKLFRK